MQLLCRNDDLTYFLGEKKNVVYGSCKRLWFWVDGRFNASTRDIVLEWRKLHVSH